MLFPSAKPPNDSVSDNNTDKEPNVCCLLVCYSTQLNNYESEVEIQPRLLCLCVRVCLNLYVYLFGELVVKLVTVYTATCVYVPLWLCVVRAVYRCVSLDLKDRHKYFALHCSHS